MSSTYAALFERLDECLDELAAIDPVYRTVAWLTDHHPNGTTTFTRRQ